MESQRTFLFIGFLLVSFLLFQEWNSKTTAEFAEPSATTQVTTTQASTSSDFVPQSSTGSLHLLLL